MVNKVVCRTEMRLGRGREVRPGSSTAVNELGRSCGRLLPASLVHYGGSVTTEMIHSVLDSLETTVRKTDMVGTGSVTTMSVLRVAKLVATVVILHGVGKYVIILWIFLCKHSGEEG